MARVTVEDCVLKVPNRFELVMLAAQRARDITSGVPMTLDRDNDKDPVVALREIAEETVSLPALEEALIKRLQKYVERDEPVEDEMDVAAIQQDIGLMVPGDLSPLEPGDEDEGELDLEADSAEASLEGGELDSRVVFEDMAPDVVDREED